MLKNQLINFFIFLTALNVNGQIPQLNPVGKDIGTFQKRFDNWLWGKQSIFEGGSLFDGSAAKSLSTDDQGRSYVLGNLGGTWSWGGYTLSETGNNSDCYLVKYNKNGAVKWAVQSTGGKAVGKDVVVSSAGDAIYITGEFQGDVTFGNFTLSVSGFGTRAFLVKYDNQGNVIWARQSEGGNAFSTSVDVDPFGNVFIGGRIANGDVLFGNEMLTVPQGVETFLVKYNLQGDAIWARQSEALTAEPTSSVVEAITTDHAGYVYITGSVGDVVSFDHVTLTTDLINKFYVVKYDPNGSVIGAIQADSDGGVSSGRSIDVDESFNIYATINYSGEMTLGGETVMASGSKTLIAKWDLLGSLKWIVNDEGNGTSSGNSLSLSKNNKTIYVTGSASVNDVIFGNKTIQVNSIPGVLYLLKINCNSGYVQWVKQDFGANSSGSAVSVDDHHNVYVCGSASGIPNLPDNNGNPLHFVNQVGTLGHYSLLVKTNSAQPFNKFTDDFLSSNSGLNEVEVILNSQDKCLMVNILNDRINLIGTKLELYDLTGKMSLNKRLDANNNELNVDFLNSGLYIISIIDQNNTLLFSNKLMVP